LAGAAAPLGKAVGVELEAALPGRRPGAQHGRLIANLRDLLGEERIAAAWEAGHG
jgi:hypothetical protein